MYAANKYKYIYINYSEIIDYYISFKQNSLAELFPFFWKIVIFILNIILYPVLKYQLNNFVLII